MKMMCLNVVDEFGECSSLRHDYLVIYKLIPQRSSFSSCLHLGIWGAKHHTSRIVKNKLRYGCGTGHAVVRHGSLDGRSLNAVVEMRSTKSNLIVNADDLAGLGTRGSLNCIECPKRQYPIVGVVRGPGDRM